MCTVYHGAKAVGERMGRTAERRRTLQNGIVFRTVQLATLMLWRLQHAAGEPRDQHKEQVGKRNTRHFV